MTLRLAGLAALGLLSSACTFRAPAAAQQPVDYSDYAAYDQPWAPSPSYRASAPAEAAPAAAPDAASDVAPAKSGNALGIPAVPGRTHGASASATEYEESEAQPGSACFEAARKAGLTRGTCTLLSERKYLLLGEK